METLQEACLHIRIRHAEPFLGALPTALFQEGMIEFMETGDG
jgi:hypothetical protein